MALSNYSELKQSIVSRSGRDDILDQLDDFIVLAEQEIWNNLRVREMLGTNSLITSTRFATLPTDYLQDRRITPLNQGSYYKNLKGLAPGSIRMIDDVTTGIPSQYSIAGQVELDVIPLSGCSLVMEYYKKLEGLSAVNATNGVLSSFPAIYLYGCLAEVYSYSEETEEEQKFRGKFFAAIQTANEAFKMSVGSSMAVSIEGATP